MSENRLSTMEIDAIGEILNISLGASATAISTMLDTRVDITTPVVKVVNKKEFAFSNLKPAVGVEITYIEGLSGKNVMLLKKTDVKIIVEMLMGMTFSDDEFELNEMNISAICEVMNQMMGASSTALSELFGNTVNISTPVSFEVEGEDQFKEKFFTEEDAMVVIQFNLKIADKMESEFLNLMSIDLAKELVGGFFVDSGVPEIQENPCEEQDAPMQETTPDMVEEPLEEQEPAKAQIITEPESSGEKEQQIKQTVDVSVMEQMMQTMQMMQQQMMEMQNAQMEKRIPVKKAPVPSLRTEESPEDPEANLDLLMGVSLELSVEIGRTKKLVKDIIELNKGSLVVLDRVAGEPVDLFVNGEHIAKGDVVVVDDNFGIRITEILQDDIFTKG